VHCTVWAQGHMRQLKGRQQPGSSPSWSAEHVHAPARQRWTTKQYLCAPVRPGCERAGPRGTDCSSDAGIWRAHDMQCTPGRLVLRHSRCGAHGHAGDVRSGRQHMQLFPWTSMLAAHNVLVVRDGNHHCSKSRPCMRGHRCRPRAGAACEHRRASHCCVPCSLPHQAR